MNIESRPVRDATPLVVDVDGALVMTDLLQEAALQLIAKDPVEALKLPLWLAGGPSRLKTELADRADPGLDTVPLREEVVSLIRQAQADGRPVYLTSAADPRYVRRLAERLGGIAGVFGAEEAGGDAAGPDPAERLATAFGKGGFDYLGDRPADRAIWRQSRRVLVVARSGGFAASVRKEFPHAEVVAEVRGQPRGYLRALRLHQWAKNVLLFLPMVGGHRFDLQTVTATIVGFFCFCFAASSAYVVNDLLDLPGDRDHPRKRRRPFAAGQVAIPQGVLMSALLMAAAFGLSLMLPHRFVLVLLIYVATTLAYSLFLKRKVLVDVITLGGLYTVRVYGGLAATGVRETEWLLMFSLCLFASLAIVKRCSELVTKLAAGKTTVMGRGYQVQDLGIMLPLGAAAGYGAVLVVALYVSSPEVAGLYRHPNRLWLLCPLLMYWVSRVLLMTNRGEMHDDPVVFALTDRISWLIGAGAAAVIAISI